MIRTTAILELAILCLTQVHADDAFIARMFPNNEEIQQGDFVISIGKLLVDNFYFIYFQNLKHTINIIVSRSSKKDG